MKKCACPWLDDVTRQKLVLSAMTLQKYALAIKTLESHIKGHDIVKVCLSITTETLESHIEGYDLVKVCHQRPTFFGAALLCRGRT